MYEHQPQHLKQGQHRPGEERNRERTNEEKTSMTGIAGEILRMQGAIGNRAVAQLLAGNTGGFAGNGGSSSAAPVQRKILLKSYNGDNDVLFERPYAGATRTMIDSMNLDEIKRGAKKKLIELISDGDTHEFDDTEALQNALLEMLGAKSEKRDRPEDVAKREHVAVSKRAKVVTDPGADEVKRGATYRRVGTISLGALRKHHEGKPGFRQTKEQFKTGLSTDEGVAPDKSDNMYKDLLTYLSVLEDGVQDVRGKIEGVSFQTQLNHETKDTDEALANTHVALTSTGGSSAYAAIHAKGFPLPVGASGNKSHHFLNALELTRDSGQFLVSMVGKRDALEEEMIEPGEAIDPMTHGTFEISGVSGQERDSYFDRVAENTSRTVDMLEEDGNEWAEELAGYADIIEDPGKTDEERFQAFKEASRATLDGIRKLTNQETLTPPTTPEYRATYDEL